MEKLIFRCIECGHVKEIVGNLDDMDREDGFCPMCGNDMDLQDTTNAITISDVVEKDCITLMTKHIKEMGNDKVWEIIEQFYNAKTRLAYRKIFFASGGEVPEKGEIS